LAGIRIPDSNPNRVYKYNRWITMRYSCVKSPIVTLMIKLEPRPP